MSKISKFIICCISLIISFVSLCVPTYCSDISSSLFTIELVDSFPNYNNYYNANNVSYVTYKNFEFVCNRVGSPILYGSNVQDIPNTIHDGDTFSKTYNDTVYGYNLIWHFDYHIGITSNAFYIHIDDYYVIGLENVVINLSPSVNSAIFSFPLCDFSFFESIGFKIDNLHIYPNFSFTYDIEYNGQYFYNDTFVFTSKSFITTGIVNNLVLKGANLFRKTYWLYDNYNDIYKSNITFTSDNYQDYNRCLFRNLLYSDRYITRVSHQFYAGYLAYGNVTNLNRLYFQFDIKYVDFDSIDSINLFSGNSSGSSGAVGSLIPNGSNNYYKTAEWWDIPSHLYNFFIYLIFDAPIISNFTNLVMVIINFIVELFDFIIGLFTGINNIFFVSIFVGIIVLIFLLKIIFKG